MAAAADQTTGAPTVEPTAQLTALLHAEPTGEPPALLYAEPTSAPVGDVGFAFHHVAGPLPAKDWQICAERYGRADSYFCESIPVLCASTTPGHEEHTRVHVLQLIPRGDVKRHQKRYAVNRSWEIDEVPDSEWEWESESESEAKETIEPQPPAQPTAEHRAMVARRLVEAAIGAAASSSAGAPMDDADAPSAGADATDHRGERW